MPTESGAGQPSSPPIPSTNAGDGQALFPGDIGSFTSPSGNIACVMATGGASCWISEMDWELTEAPAGCEDADWGNALYVSADGAGPDCYTDFSWDPAAPALGYGSTMTVGDVTCTSARTGVTCLHAGGAGFLLSRGRVEVF